MILGTSYPMCIKTELFVSTEYRVIFKSHFAKMLSVQFHKRYNNCDCSLNQRLVVGDKYTT